MANKPIIAIIGRPNVGKSTFVNRLIGNRASIVDDLAGVTRDRIYFDVEWLSKQFTLIDTGGIIPNDEDDLMQNIKAQAEIACSEADKIIFLVDGKSGINPVDYDIANLLRQTDKPVYVVANKVDNPEEKNNIFDFYALGLGEIYPVSAIQGCGGIGDLLDEVTKDFENCEVDYSDKIKIAIVGKPNAGKSSIVNALLDEERSIVSDVSGTTRDCINSNITYNDTDFVLIDTAGIRKKAKVDWGVEKFAVDRAIRAIRDTDVAVLVIDATEGLSDQDKKIASIILESGKAMVLAVNKWDLIPDKTAETLSKFDKNLSNEVPFLSFVPKIFISAKTKQRINSIFDESLKVYEQANKKISTSLLNKIISEAFVLNPATTIKGKLLKIYYTTQVKSAPPTFVMFINNKDLLKDSYKRYIENKLREAFGFFGTPIRIGVREKENKKKWG